MLAVPLWLLYELGIVVARFVGRSTVPGAGDLDEELKQPEAGQK
jgi:Sec-independent protein secretion pathway component TatC